MQTRLNEVKSRSTFESRYEKLYTLGKGNFGKVYLAEHRESGTQYAVKVVDKKLFKSGDQKQHAQREQMICETFASGLIHKNIVKVHEVLAENDYIYVVMEYVEGGELFDKIKQSRGLAEPTARRWFREIIEAVEYIHENNIVHRDLKPENVLIDKTQKIKICDFGFGNVVREQHEVLSTYCGSPFYAAPEMVTATPYQGPPVDLWSCGVILYAMLTGSLPFQGDEMPRLFQKISRGQYSIPPYVTRDASDLIQRLLCRNANERITAKDCLLHPWLAPPSITRCSLNTSQLTINSRLTSFSNRKKVSVLSTGEDEEDDTLSTLSTLLDSKMTTTATESTHLTETIPSPKQEECDRKVVLYQTSSPFYLRLFKKKGQVAPMTESIQHEKKVLKTTLMCRFRGLFKGPFQKRIT